MQVMFVDETERDKKLKKGSFFCISGLCVDENKLRTVNRELIELRDGLGIANFKQTRDLNYSSQTKINLARLVRDILEKNSVSARAVIIGDVTLSEIDTHAEKYMSALFFMIERWYITLRKNSETGLMICDSLGSKREPALCKRFYEHISTKKSTYYGESFGVFSQHIYPTLLFCPDDNSPVLQIADLIGTTLNHAVRSRVNANLPIQIEKLPELNPFLKEYWPIFFSNPTGIVRDWGIKNWY